jgi:hypothetical protein
MGIDRMGRLVAVDRRSWLVSAFGGLLAALGLRRRHRLAFRADALRVAMEPLLVAEGTIPPTSKSGTTYTVPPHAVWVHKDPRS